jgi:bacteriocin biosynthesis cyclodehydratase domain-containing protein
MWRFRSTVDAHLLDDGLLVLSEARPRTYAGAAFAEVARLLDGTRDGAAIQAALAGQLSTAEIRATLQRLYRDGLIVRVPAPADPAAVFAEGRRQDDAARADRLANFTVAVVSADPELVIAICTNLNRIGVRTDPTGDEAAELTVLVVADYLDPELAAVNERRLSDGGQWLLINPYGQRVSIGPRFVPGGTGCWQCLSERLLGNRPAERYLARRTDQTPARPNTGLLPGVDGLIAAMLGAEILAVAEGQRGQLAGKLRTISWADLEPRTQSLDRLAHCPACGNPAKARYQPENVASRLAETGSAPPWQRLLGPSELAAIMARSIGPDLGAVAALEPTRYRTLNGRHTYLAQHGFPLSGKGIESLRRDLVGQSSGSGRTVEAARASAYCEAIERYSGVWLAGTPTIGSSLADLGRRAVHPNEIMLYSEGQYQHRTDWNSSHPGASRWVPEAFSEQARIGFTPGWSLTERELVLVPSGLVWYGQPDLRSHRYAAADSNGCAAGGNLAEATLHALCELHERDAAAIWWYNRAHRPEVELDPVQDGWVPALLRDYRAAGRDVWVLDLTVDLGMPCYVAISHRTETGTDVLFGFGAHPVARLAVRRALQEMDQLSPLLGDSPTGGSYHAGDPAAVTWFGSVSTQAETWLLPHGTVPLPDVVPAPATTTDTIAELVAGLHRAGIEAIVIDQSRPELELAVARVIAPGLRHFRRRNAPGRLYDVPVRLGWRSKPIAESELNPLDIFT